MAIQVSIIDKYESLLALEHTWRECYAMDDRGNPFLSFEWVSLWWKHFGARHTLSVAIAYAGDRPICIAPTMCTRLGFLRILSFIGGELSDYSDFLVVPDDGRGVRAVLDTVMADRGSWYIAKFDRLREDSPVLVETSMLRRTVATRDDPLPSLVFEKDASRVKKIVESRTVRRSLSRLGRVELRTSGCDVEQALRLYRIFVDQHRCRWPSSMFNDSRFLDFFSDLLGSLLPRGEMELFHLDRSGEPIAFLICFTSRGRCQAYLSSYDQSHSHGSPGQGLLRFVMKYCMEHGFSELDLMRGNEPYKRQLANTLRGTVTARVHTSAISYCVDQAMWLLKRAKKGLSVWLGHE